MTAGCGLQLACMARCDTPYAVRARRGLTKGAATRIAARQPLKVAGCTVGGSGPVPQSTTGPGAVAG